MWVQIGPGVWANFGGYWTRNVVRTLYLALVRPAVLLIPYCMICECPSLQGDISPYEEIEASSLARLVEEGIRMNSTLPGGHGHLDENVEHAPPISVFGNDYDQMPPEISPHGKMDLTLTHMLVRRIPPQLPLLRRPVQRPIKAITEYELLLTIFLTKVAQHRSTRAFSPAKSAVGLTRAHLASDPGESPITPPRKAATRSHRSSRNGKNGPAVTSRAWHFTRGNMGTFA
ncbi:hypothetical protein PCH_Pc13g10130 [Penicillium rubens Wisconsin 54-1255]|uniref:Uncharacterized protein n=1 Tax=Penicillium rubens (strain ATCC 28089 / DSM 1075 / NRRL 1951 / Wisconsin 54-1255) TaxID=500485 RepID=B6H4R3_PENRW|nr:hypothetical protein PCH_Pc13g10130 [Penicillium rubens Wisconsin 54-1255]